MWLGSHSQSLVPPPVQQYSPCLSYWQQSPVLFADLPSQSSLAQSPTAQNSCFQAVSVPQSWDGWEKVQYKAKTLYREEDLTPLSHPQWSGCLFLPFCFLASSWEGEHVCDGETVSHSLKEAKFSTSDFKEREGRRRFYKTKSKLPLVTLCFPCLPCSIPPEHSPVVSRCREQTIIRCCRALPGSSVLIFSCPVIFPDCRNTTLLLSWLLVENFPGCYAQEWVLPSSPSFCNQGWVWLFQLAPCIINKWSCRISAVTLR